MTRTVVGLVEATWNRVQLGGRIECTILLDQAAALDAEVAALRARVAELEAPRSPHAMELAGVYAVLLAEKRSYGMHGNRDRQIERMFEEARDNLAAYDKRGPK